MSDRELLELAARAAGIEVSDWLPGTLGFRFDGRRWNPLTDDGDALRLAVKLKIDLDFFPSIGEVHTFCAEDGGETAPHECFGTDPYAATRRAIVRAAAAIGASMAGAAEGDKP